MPGTPRHGKMRIVTVNIPKPYLKHIQRLLDIGLCPSRSEYIRWAVGNQITRDFEREKKMAELINKSPLPPLTVRVPKGWDYIEGFNGNKPFKTKPLEKKVYY